MTSAAAATTAAVVSAAAAVVVPVVLWFVTQRAKGRAQAGAIAVRTSSGGYTDGRQLTDWNGRPVDPAAYRRQEVAVWQVHNHSSLPIRDVRFEEPSSAASTSIAFDTADRLYVGGDTFADFLGPGERLELRFVGGTFDRDYGTAEFVDHMGRRWWATSLGELRERQRRW